MFGRNTATRGAQIAEARGLAAHGYAKHIHEHRDIALEQSEQLGRIEALLERMAAAAEAQAQAIEHLALAQRFANGRQA